MTLTTEETPAPRTALFYGLTIAATIIAVMVGIGGGSVQPLLDMPALVQQVTEQPAAESPVNTPVEPGVGAPEPSTPAATDPCAAPASAFATTVCEATGAYGWTVTTASALSEGVAFTALADGLPPLASGQDVLAPDIAAGHAVRFAHERDGVMTASIEPLPAQSTAGVADEIRGVLGVDAVYFFEGGALTDGPSMYFGEGWTIAAAHDPTRTVGQVVTVGPRTLTVTASDPATGTVYAVA